MAKNTYTNKNRKPLHYKTTTNILLIEIYKNCNTKKKKKCISTFNDLFNIVQVFRMMKIEFDKQFLITQREKGCYESLLGIDLKCTKKSKNYLFFKHFYICKIL